MEGTIGEIRLFAATFSPRNWWYCDGSIIAIRSNTALFSILGTTYGGDGTTTFALPDFRGRTVIGAGEGPGLTEAVLGEKAGTNSVTLNITNLPAHTHQTAPTQINIPAFSDEGNTNVPSGHVLAAKPNMYTSEAGDSDLRAATVSTVISPSGNNQALSINQPSLGMNYIVCLTGVFPARN